MLSLRSQGGMGGERHQQLAGEEAEETCSPRVAKEIRNTPRDTFLNSQEGRKEVRLQGQARKIPQGRRKALLQNSCSTGLLEGRGRCTRKAADRQVPHPPISKAATSFPPSRGRSPTPPPKAPNPPSRVAVACFSPLFIWGEKYTGIHTFQNSRCGPPTSPGKGSWRPRCPALPRNSHAAERHTP